MAPKYGINLAVFSVISLFITVLSTSRCVFRQEDECGSADCTCVEGEKMRGCFRETSIDCFNGKCNENFCQCFPCYTGESCNITANRHQPIFTKTEYYVYLDPFVETVISDVRARDTDCTEQGCSEEHDCPCCSILYSIEKGNEDALFTIDQRTGDIRYNPKNHLQFSNSYHLVVSARNNVKSGRDGVKKHAFTDLHIVIEDSVKSRYGMSDDSGTVHFSQNTIDIKPLELARIKDGVVHHRSKRSTAASSTANVTFSLVKTGDFATKSEVKIGDQIPFNLTVVVPKSTTRNVQLEIYAPKASSTIMLICKPSVAHMGSNFHNRKAADVVAQMQAKAGDNKYDRAVVQLGDLINNGSSSAEIDSTVVIQFAVTVTDNSAFVNGAKFSVSVGARYGVNQKVWVGQAEFTASRLSTDTLTSTSSPQFSAKGPSEVMKGITEVWTVSMTLRDAVNTAVLDVYTHVNTSVEVMTINRLSVSNTGQSYSCYAVEKAKQTLNKKTTSSANYVIGTLDLGQVVNSGFRQSNAVTADNTITIEIAATLLNTSDVVAGNKYKIGFSAEIDSKSIWTSTVEYTATEQNPSNQTAVLPSFKMSVSNDEITPGGQTSLQLNMSFPEKSSQMYLLEGVLPANYTDIFEACKVYVRHIGFNFPTFKEISPVFTPQGKREYIQIELGRITNTGQKHGAIDNIITLEFLMQMRADASVSADQVFWPTLGVRYDEDSHWVGQQAITTKMSPAQMTYKPSPEVTYTNIMKEEKIYQGSSSSFYLDVFLPAKSTFEKIDVTFTNPIVNDTAVLKFCRIEIVHVGNHFGCYNTTNVSAVLEKTAGLGADDDFTSGKMTLEMVSNAGEWDYPWIRNDSVIRIEVVVMLTEDHDMGNSSVYSTVAEVEYKTGASTSKLTRFGNLTCYPRQMADLEEFDPDPTFSLSDVINKNPMYPGQPAVFNVDMVLPPRSMATYQVEAIVNHTALTVCRIAAISSGHNVPCFSKNSETMYMSYEDDSQHDRASLDMGVISNIGQLPIAANTKTENTITTQVVAMLRWDSLPSISPGASYYLGTSVQTGSGRVWVSQTSITATKDAKTETSVPVGYLRKGNNDTSLTKGGAAVFFLDLYIPADTFASYVIEFDAPSKSSDIGKLSICDARVTSAGFNIPCINSTYMGISYKSDSANKTVTKATINAGVIGNIGTKGTATEMPLNKVTAELTVEVPATSSASGGDKLSIAASVKRNNEVVYQGSIDVPVTESLQANEVAPNVTSVVVVAPQEDNYNETIYNGTLRIAETKTWMINVSIPEMTSNFKLVIKMPKSNGESLMTMSNVRYCGWNMNLPCSKDKEPVVNITSTLGTSQNDHGVAVLGIISNTGISKRNQWLKEKFYDDIFSVCFDMQATDHKDNLNGTVNEFDVELDYSNNRQIATKGNVTILVYEDESPQVDVTVTGSDKPTGGYRPLDIHEFTVHFNHTSNSTAHVYNFSVNFLFPKYVEYAGSVNYEPDWSAPQVVKHDNSTAVSFKYPVVYFTDNIEFSFNVSMDPKRSLTPRATLIYDLISYDVTYDQSNVKVAANTEPEKLLFQTPMESFEFEMSVPECRDALGIEDGSIADCQITASSHYSTFQAKNARLGSSSAWISSNRGVPFQQKEYIQVNLGNKTRVTGLTVQGNGDRWLTSFSLQYSDEGIRWFDYLASATTNPRVFPVSSNSSDDYVWVPLADRALVTRYLRIIPKSNSKNDHYMALRFELHGCTVSDDVATDQVCENPDPLPPLPFYKTGYLVNPVSGVAYACTPNQIGADPFCSYSDDNGTTWTGLEEDVTNINFLRTDSGYLYGLAGGRRSLVISEDNGETWFGLSKAEYDEAKQNASLVVEAKPMSFDDIESKSYTTLISEFGLTSTAPSGTVQWCGEYDGLSVKGPSEQNSTLTGYWGDRRWRHTSD